MIHIEMHIHFHFMAIRLTNWWCGFFRYHFFSPLSPLYSVCFPSVGFFFLVWTFLFQFQCNANHMQRQRNINVSSWKNRFLIYGLRRKNDDENWLHTHTHSYPTNLLTTQIQNSKKEHTNLCVGLATLPFHVLLYGSLIRRRRRKNWRNNYASVF